MIRRKVALSVVVFPLRLAGERGDELRLGIPGEENPGILRDFGDERVHHRLAGGLGVDGGEMRLWQEVADHLGGGAGIDEVVDDQEASAVAGGGGELGDLGFADGFLFIGDDGDAFYEPDFKLAGDDGGGDEAAAGDGDNAGPGAFFVQAPGQGFRVAVELVPGDGVVVRGHGNAVVQEFEEVKRQSKVAASNLLSVGSSWLLPNKMLQIRGVERGLYIATPSLPSRGAREKLR